MGQKKNKKEKCGEYEFEKLPANYDTVPEPFEYRRLVVEFNSLLSELNEERSMVEHLSSRVRSLEIKERHTADDKRYWMERCEKSESLSDSRIGSVKALVMAVFILFTSTVASITAQVIDQSDSTPPVKESSKDEDCKTARQGR